MAIAAVLALLMQWRTITYRKWVREEGSNRAVRALSEGAIAGAAVAVIAMTIGHLMHPGLDRNYTLGGIAGTALLGGLLTWVTWWAENRVVRCEAS